MHGIGTPGSCPGLAPPSEDGLDLLAKRSHPKSLRPTFGTTE